MKYKEQIGSSIAFFLGFIFITAGIEKHTGLADIIGPHNLIDELAKHNLKTLGQFIAYSQLFIGFMLIHNRFRTLGSIMLLPMLLNILVVTISLQWQGTPYIISFFLILNIILLLIDFHKIKFLFSDKENPELVNIKPKRKNLKVDLIFISFLIVIIIGCYLGSSSQGVNFAKTGLFLILATILVLKILRLINRKNEQK